MKTQDVICPICKQHITFFKLDAMKAHIKTHLFARDFMKALTRKEALYDRSKKSIS